MARATVRGVLRRPPRRHDSAGASRLSAFGSGSERTTAVAMNNSADRRAFTSTRHELRGMRGGRDGIRARARPYVGRDVDARGVSPRPAPSRRVGRLRVRADEFCAGTAGTGADRSRSMPRLYLTEVLVHRGAASTAQRSTSMHSCLPQRARAAIHKRRCPVLAAAALVASCATGPGAGARPHPRTTRRSRRSRPGWRTYCLTWPARHRRRGGRRCTCRGVPRAGRAPWSNWMPAHVPRPVRCSPRPAGRHRRGARCTSTAAERWEEWGSVPFRAYALLGLGRCAAMRRPSRG